MGFGACKTYDLEVWIPDRTPTVRSLPAPTFGISRHVYAGTLSQQVGQENPSGSYPDGSGLAVGRTLVAVMENYQQVMVVLKYQKFCVRI